MVLTFLKYAGLLIAAISSIWGITTDVSKDIKERKKLTREGYISIFLVLFGFLISVGSTIIEDHQNAIEHESALRQDIRRTNRIILAGQPLTSLIFSWTFDGVDKHTLRQISKGDSISSRQIMDYQQGGVRGPSQNGPAFRLNSLYPFIKSIIKSTSDNIPECFLLLISLDNNQNAILPIGYISDSTVFRGNKLASNLNDSTKFPVGVETIEGNMASFEGYGNPQYNFPQMRYLNNSVFIDWKLDPVTFLNSVNNQIPNVYPSSNFPDTLKVALLYDFHLLPFASSNFAISPDYLIWEYNPDLEPLGTTHIQKNLLFKSSIHFTPNNLMQQTINYNFLRFFAQSVSEKESGESYPCNSIILYYVRQE